MPQIVSMLSLQRKIKVGEIQNSVTKKVSSEIKVGILRK